MKCNPKLPSIAISLWLFTLFYSHSSAQNYALFFACNQYGNQRDLENPIPNAKSIASILEKDYGFFSEIVENPTLEEIDKKLENYKDSFSTGQRNSKGQLLIFFSGHGAIENNVGYFLPSNAVSGKYRKTAIDYHTYRNLIDEMDCQHIFVAVDACFSVRFDPLWKYRPDNQFQRVGEKSEREKLLLSHDTTITRIFFTSDGNEKETPDRSNFAKKFLEGLYSGGGPDGILTSSELYGTVANASPKPHCSEFGKDNPYSSFLFIKEKWDISVYEAELKAWKKSQKKNTIQSYKEFLFNFPNGDFVEIARNSITTLQKLSKEKDEEEAWNQVESDPTIAGYKKFISRYPESKWVTIARLKIEELEEEVVKKLDDEAFAKAREKGTILSLQEYLEKFENGIHRKEARELIDELNSDNQAKLDVKAWIEAKEQGTDTAFKNYLLKFPFGEYREVAQLKLQELKTSKEKEIEWYPKMIFIKGGTLEMGAKKGGDDEEPIHEVSIESFEIAETEVTNRQYMLFVEETDSHYPIWMDPSIDAQKSTSGRINPRKMGEALKVNNHPVVGISWEDASAYCNWLSKKTGSNYRLPTEAEWEYAASSRGLDNSKWAGTDSKSSLRRYGNYSGIAGEDKFASTAPVKSFDPNSLGLYDMSGNVWEWCLDWYDRDFYSESPFRNPKGPEYGIEKVYRGGGWDSDPSSLRIKNRSYWFPKSRDYDLGFRPARTL